MQRPLIILLHGVGGSPAAMAPLADRIAAAMPHARTAAVPAAFPYDLSLEGRQWFSVDGITEENRPGRIQAALGAFTQAIREQQRRHDTGPRHTVLAGFSQGAIMALAGCGMQDEGAPLARHVLAIGGRFAPLPDTWPRHTAVSLVHGALDGTMPAEHSRRAAARLAELGADVRLDLVPRGLHMLSPAIVDAALLALQRPLA
jgi:phospholipase/carboxylesterase